MLFLFFCLLSTSLHWTAWNITCPYLHCFLGFVTDVKCFGGSLAAVVFVLCWGTFSGSLALLPLSSPLPSFAVGGLISEQDKLFSPLLSLWALSCWFSHLASGQCKQRQGPDCFRSPTILASIQWTCSIKAFYENPFSPKRYMYPKNLFPGAISSSRLIWLTGLSCLKEKVTSVKELIAKHVKIRKRNCNVGAFYRLHQFFAVYTSMK